MRSASKLFRIASALLAGSLSLAACGDEGGGASPTTASTPATVTVPQTTFDNALWPDPANAREASTPVEVARSFVEELVGFEDPPLGAFQQGDSRSGEVPVFGRGENGEPQRDRVVSTIALRQLDGVRWFVIAAVSDRVQIARPDALQTISSPVRVTGEAEAFEGAIVLRLFGAFDPEALVEKGAQAGGMSLEPFSADLQFERPPAATGAIVVHDVGAVAGPKHFSAIGVRFAGG